MAIDVALVRDTIRKDGSTVPRVVNRRTIEVDTLLEEMAKDTGLEVTDMRAVFERLKLAVATYLPNGDAVRTPIGTFTLSVSGGASEGADSDPSHPTADRSLSPERIRVRFRVDPGLRQRLEELSSVQIVDVPPLQQPVVQRVANTESAEGGSTGTAGELIQLFGSRLSFDKSDPEVGVFFVAEDESETRVSGYGRIGSSFITCKIPQVAAGQYTVQVRTKPTNRDVRMGAAEDPFIVS